MSYGKEHPVMTDLRVWNAAGAESLFTYAFVTAVGIDDILNAYDEIRAQRDELAACIGTLRERTGCSTLNVSDVSAEQHEKDIGRQYDALKRLLAVCDEVLSDVLVNTRNITTEIERVLQNNQLDTQSLMILGWEMENAAKKIHSLRGL